LFTNITINSVNNSKIRCLDSTGTISFENVAWIQDSDATFSQGRFDVLAGGLHMYGNGFKFSYKSSQTSTIRSNGTLILDQGLTLSYDSPTTSQTLLTFADSTGLLQLAGGTLRSTTTGLQLTKGNFQAVANSTIASEGSASITLGTGVAANDCVTTINPGVTLSLSGGILAYRNVNASSLNIGSANSTLALAATTTLNAFQSFNIAAGLISLGTNATIASAAGQSISSTIGGLIPASTYFYNPTLT
jgi:hypothetical protein